jgi:CDP-diacylglycerol--glycerol-3-phosphate 3-phosphatidyltransferase
MSDIMSKVTAPAPQASAFSLPNLLTFGRIAAVPVVAGLLMWGGDWARWTALVLFIAAGISDFFDGYLARKWRQQSEIGRMLDPIADKVLVAAVLLVLTVDRTVSGGHVWAAIIILSREVLVSGLREFLAELRVSVPVTAVAKWKTTVQLVAVGFLIAGPAGDRLIGHVTEFGLAGLWLAAGLTLYTGYDYFRAGIGHVTGDK